jgi:DNA repair exonuclease SbcCD nuclease subunit
MLHGVAAGMKQFAMADLGEQEFPIELLEQFDYAALGHYHNSVAVTDRAWYAGSTERLSQAERESSKGFLEVNLEPFSVTFHEVHSREMVDLTIHHAAGERGDSLVKRIQAQLGEIDSSGKIVRVKVLKSTPELLKTLPSEELTELKSSTFSLDIRFERDADGAKSPEFGPTSIGRLDKAFLEYLDTVSLDGLDRDRLVQTAQKYLTSGE